MRLKPEILESSSCYCLNINVEFSATVAQKVLER